MREKFFTTYSLPTGQALRPGNSSNQFLTKEDALGYAKQLATNDRAGAYDYYVLEAMSVIHRQQSPVVVSDVGTEG